MGLQKLLKHLPSSEQEIGVAALAPELERVLGRCRLCDNNAATTRSSVRACIEAFEVGRNGDLEFAFDVFGQRVEIGGGCHPWQIGAWRDSHVCFKRDVVLKKNNEK